MKRRGDDEDQLGIGELARRKVDIDPQVGKVIGDLPGPALTAGLVDHPASDRHDLAGLLGQADEVGRHVNAMASRVPAHKRLEPDRVTPAARELHDGLIDQGELVPFRGAAQARAKLAAGRRLFQELGSEDLDAATTGVLGRVHGDVGVAQEIVSGLAAGPGQGDADARPHARRAVAEIDGRPEDLEDALRHLSGHCGSIDVLEEDRELIAAQAGRRVARADRRPDTFGDDLEGLVAPRVSEAVVEELEVVDIEEEDRGPEGAPAPEAVEDVGDAVVEEDAVGQARSARRGRPGGGSGRRGGRSRARSPPPGRAAGRDGCPARVKAAGVSEVSSTMPIDSPRTTRGRMTMLCWPIERR